MKFDVIVAASKDKVSGDVRLPFTNQKRHIPVLSTYLQSKRTKKAWLKWMNKCMRYGETFYRPDEDKIFETINGKPLIEHSLDAIAASDQSFAAGDLDLEGCIGKIIVVGDKDKLEREVTFPKDREIIIVEEHGSLFGNMLKGFKHSFDDCMVLPDIDQGFVYLNGRTMKKKNMSWMTKAVMEFYSALATEVKMQGAFSGDYTVYRNIATDVILPKRDELISRNHLPSRLKFKDEDRLVDSILNNVNIFESLGDSYAFKDGRLDYFAEYDKRLEKPVVFLAADSPLYNPGLIHTIHQYIHSYNSPEILFNLVSQESLQPYPNPNGKPRPYMHFEHMLRTVNGHIAKVNKVGNVRVTSNIYGNVRLLKLGNMLWMARKLSYDSDARKFRTDGLNTVSAAIWNQLSNVNYLMKHHPEENPSLYAEKVQSYWDLREKSSIASFEKIMGEVFRANLRVNISPFGGLSIDLDSSDVDKLWLNQNLQSWKKMQHIEYQKLARNGLLMADDYREYLDSQLRKQKELLGATDNINDFYSFITS